MEEQKKEEVKKPEPVKVTVTAPASGNAEVHLPHPDPAHPDLHVTVAAPVVSKPVGVAPVIGKPVKSRADRFIDGLFIVVLGLAVVALVVHLIH